METLFYKLMYDKQLKRGMTILEILYRTKHDVAIKELEVVLNVSKKTVLSTLEFTKMLLEENTRLVVTEKSVKLLNNSEYPIEVVLVKIARQTIPTRVMEHVFYDRNLNIRELAEELFVSESTLRSIITHMNKTLSLFNCSLSFYDVKMLGAETDIRYFFYAYFSEFQELFSSVFGDKLQCCIEIFEDMKKTSVEQKSGLLNYSHQQVIRWLLITRERLELKKYVHVKEAFIKDIKERHSYKIFKTIYEANITRHLRNQQIPETEVVWAYVTSFNTIIYLKDSCQNLHIDGEDTKHCKEKISVVLDRVADALRFPNDNREEFFAIGTAYLLNLSLLTKLSMSFQIGSEAVKSYIANSLEGLYEIWTECLSEITEEDLFPISNVHTLATQLTMISSQFAYRQKTRVEKVLFSFEGESGFPAYLETLAKRRLPNGVEGIFVYNEPITASLIEKIQPNIIVCNYQMREEFRSCKLLRMSYVPQIQEWTMLEKLIINLDCD